MKNRFCVLVLTLCLVSSAALYGQDKEKKEDSPVEVSGLMYLEWAHLNGYQSNSINRVYYGGLNSQTKSHNDTFRVQRVYLTVKKNLGAGFSARVTTDVDTDSQNYLYLKYAYVQWKKSFGPEAFPLTLSGQLGKIGTPNAGLLVGLIDLRWINANYLFVWSKVVLDNYVTDNSADFGAKATIDLGKRVAYTFSITNGEGFKNAAVELSSAFDAKAYTHLVTITPMKKWLYINFHYRDEISEKKNITDAEILTYFSNLIYGVTNTSGIELGPTREKYWGGSVAWKMDALKAGIGIIFPEKRFARQYSISGTMTNPIYTQKYVLAQGWVHFNMGALVKPVPLIVIGQMAYGKKLGSDAAYSSSPADVATKTSVLTGLGLGWQFNKYFRLALYWEHQTYAMKSTGVAKSLAGQAYSATSLTNWFNTKDPKNKSNLYLKVEAKF